MHPAAAQVSCEGINHALLKSDGKFCRRNEIRQCKMLKCRSEVELEKLISGNFALFKHEPVEYAELNPTIHETTISTGHDKL